MEILISVLAKIVECTVEPVGRELGYLCFIHENFQKLNNEVEVLKDTRESVQHKVCIARRNAEDIKTVVEKWLSEIDDIVGKSELILANEGGHGRLCSTNLIQRYKISRKARKMADKVHEMKNEGENFEIVSYKAVVSLVESSLPKVLDFLYFESRKSTMEQIINALSDVNVHKIGVYGMGGIGKTMLVKEILRKIVENKSFGEVVILTISQTPDMKIIQEELADKLGLIFEQQTIEGRALKLQKRLKNEKSILIVLDDVWKPIDLEKIGFPSVEDNIGCKLLLTTRERYLISTEMCVDKIFEIKTLEKDESWNLFKEMTGEIVETCDLKPIAIQIVRECAGLPITITIVAKALKDKPSPIWIDALDQLKRDDVVVNIRGMNKKVYSSIKLSYDYLESEEVKLLFLLCSMFREDLDIDVKELQVYAMGLGFLRGVDTVAQGRRRTTKLVDDLISSSLLLQSEFGNNYVKMHDIVLDVSISIASQHDYIRTFSYVKSWDDELKEEKLLGNYTVVSLIIKGLHDPLSKLMLPKVQLLTLDGASLYEYLSVVEIFFEEMKELKGLELSKVEMSLFPPSLSSFANIRFLRLCYCKFGNIDMIGELKKVEILDLSGSNITQLPTTICQLTQLKVLNLNECNQLKVIPPNILSKLTKLEELNLFAFDGWEGEEWYEGRKNASLSELRYLPHLYVLDLTIQDEKIIPKHLFLGELNLEKFHIGIGCKTFYYKNDFLLRKLDLKIESGSYLNDWIKTLLKRSESVHLEGSICSKTLHLEFLDANEFLHLKHLSLYDSLEVQHLIHEKNKHLQKCISKLEYLKIEKLENMESITHGYDGESAFNKLRDVFVWNCHKLETLFFNCNMDDVLNLEQIEIGDCMKMEVMISVMDDEEATNHIEFTHLKSIYLRRLPRLQKFCSKNEKVGRLSHHNNSENLERSTIKIDIGGSFFMEEVSLPNLEQLNMHHADNLKMIWSNVLIPNSFSRLKEVEISSCNNLEKVFPPNMMSLLICLNILKIKDCELLKGIFEVQESITVTETASFVVLQNLWKLTLRNLPNLEYVWNKNPCELLSFVNIESLSIAKCSKLKREYSVKILRQLEKVSIDMKQLMRVLEEKKTADHMMESKQLETSKVDVLQLGGGSKLFPKLKALNLYGFLDYTSTHLPMQIVQILCQLKRFELEGVFIEEIIPIEILIPMKKLRVLVLSKLPKLRHLWNECSQTNTSVHKGLWHLKISECGALSSLVPSSMSFANLGELIVYKCHKLTHLLDASVARTLVLLNYLVLEECKRMTTIIEGGAEEGNDEIVFKQLRRLRLYSFSKLTSFYSGRCIIKFPCLIKVSIGKCPEMKVFSLGIVSTPDLKLGNLSYDDHNVYYPPKDSIEIMVENINVIIRENWENNIDTKNSFSFEEQASEENQCEHSSSHVEE